MFCKKLLRNSASLYSLKNKPNKYFINFPRSFFTSHTRYEEKKEKQKSVVLRDLFKSIENKNKNTYLEAIKIFVCNDNIYRRGHVEFIYSALKSMEEFGVQKDLEVYKALIDILPKGKFVPQNIIQAEFMHYPKQQQCILDLLEQMEEYGVMPDYEMEDMLLSIFGRRGYPVRKFWRMMYWMPKFKNLTPWPIPDPLPTDTMDLAKIAIQRISSVEPNMKVSDYYTADINESIDDTWIISAQSEPQKVLLSKNKVEDAVYVVGPFKVWLKDRSINYFILRGKPIDFNIEILNSDQVSKINPNILNLKPPGMNLLKTVPTVHEQEDGTIFSICATGTSSKDSLLSWIRHLEKDGNPHLASLQVVFTLRSGPKEVANVGEDQEEDDAKRQEENAEKIDEK